MDGGSGQHNRLLRHGETRSGTIREAGSELPSGCGDLLLVAATSFPAQEPGAGRGREVPDADRVNTGCRGRWPLGGCGLTVLQRRGAAAGATSGGEVVAARELEGVKIEQRRGEVAAA